MTLRQVPAKKWKFVPSGLLGIFDFNPYFSTVLPVVKWKLLLMESIRLPRIVGRFMFQNEERFVWLYKTKVWLSTRKVTYADFVRKGKKVQYDKIRIGDMMAPITQRMGDSDIPHDIKTRDDRYIPQWVKIAVVLRDGGRCVYCFESDPRLLEFDHRKSWVKGGSSKDPDNICLGCRPCNRKKGAKDWGWG